MREDGADFWQDGGLCRLTDEGGAVEDGRHPGLVFAPVGVEFGLVLERGTGTH